MECCVIFKTKKENRKIARQSQGLSPILRGGIKIQRPSLKKRHPPLLFDESVLSHPGTAWIPNKQKYIHYSENVRFFTPNAWK